MILSKKERRPCTGSEGTHGIKHTWGAWISPRVMNILTFAIGWRWKPIEDDKLIDGCEKKFSKGSR